MTNVPTNTSGQLREAFATLRDRTLPRRSDYPRNSRTWSADLLAGLTVAIVALPLAMGFGVASGVGVGPGLITAIVAGIVGAIFGGSRFQVTGPTGAMAVVLVPAVAEHGAAAVPVLAIMAGGLVLAAGWMGLGRAVSLVPWPVIEGFTFGIATIIFLQQLPLLLDTPRPDGESTALVTIELLRTSSIDEALPTLGLGVAVMLAILVARRLLPPPLVPLAIVAAATVGVWLTDLDVPRIGSINLATLIQPPAVPTLQLMQDLASPAIIVALLAALESLLSARVADGMSDGLPTDPDRELVGQGLANIASGVVGGMPATGAIARTAVSVRSGARTRVASLTHAIILALLLTLAIPLIAQIPLAALAGVLMATAIGMVDPATVRALLRAGRSSALVFVLTAGTTIVFDLTRAVEVGVLVTAILVLRTTARQSGIEEVELNEHIDEDELEELLHEHVVVYRLHGSLFFGAAQQFLDELSTLTHARVVVLRLGALHVLDATGAHILAETIDDFAARNITTILCGIRPPHRKLLAALDIPGERLAHQQIHADLRAALAQAREIATSDTPTSDSRRSDCR